MTDMTEQDMIRTQIVELQSLMEIIVKWERLIDDPNLSHIYESVTNIVKGEIGRLLDKKEKRKFLGFIGSQGSETWTEDDIKELRAQVLCGEIYDRFGIVPVDQFEIKRLK